MKKLTIWDNNGETWDRFTIMENKTGEMMGASEFPFSPLGFGQYVGNVANNYWQTAYGAGWHRDISKRLLQSRISFAVKHFLNDSEHMGKRIKFSQLPKDVQQFAKTIF